jgi:SAM-dependent MidA family methyltransferase
VLAARIRRRGPIPYDEVIEAALYDPEHGFYAGGGAAGRRGDFLTSPEVGPLFGAVLGRAIDAWWADLGAPDPFVVAEAGAGTGALAVAVLAAQPACAPALRWVLVERSAALRARHGEHLHLSHPALALGPSVPDDDGLPRPAAPGSGPQLVSLTDLPRPPGPCVVLANELLDNLAFRVLERASDGWREVRVGLGHDESLAEVAVAATENLAVRAQALAPDAPIGGRIPVQDAAAEWLRTALDTATGARVVVFDYAATTAELATRPEGDWLRTYAGHERGTDALADLGRRDITGDVCVDQLARVRRPDLDRDQATFLRAHGLDELVEEGRRIWTERAAIGDLDALRARSRVAEAEALTDPSGLGAFRVLEWGC